MEPRNISAQTPGRALTELHQIQTKNRTSTYNYNLYVEKVNDSS